jgi:lysophospholipase L1-like esterase
MATSSAWPLLNWPQRPLRMMCQAGVGAALPAPVALCVSCPSRWNAFIDLDRVLKSPAHPSWLPVAYDSRDHLHPNDAGHAAIARSIKLSPL